MGYSVSISLQDVRILAKNVPGAIEALSQLMREEVGEAFDRSPEETWDEVCPRECFDWVRTEPLHRALKEGDIIQALKEWRYEAETLWVSDLEKLATLSEYEDVFIKCFNSDRWGDDDRLWRALAPYIESGAIIEMRVEEQHYWRYVFQGGKLIEQQGHIEWV